MILTTIAGLGTAATPLLLDYLLSNWLMALAVLLLLVTLVFVAIEYEEEKPGKELGADVGWRLSNSIGGIAGLTGGILTGLLGAMYETGVSFGQIGVHAGHIFNNQPEFFSGLIVAALGSVSLSGLIRLTPMWFFGVALVILGVGGIVASMQGRRWRRGRA